MDWGKPLVTDRFIYLTFTIPCKPTGFQEIKRL